MMGRGHNASHVDAKMQWRCKSQYAKDIREDIRCVEKIGQNPEIFIRVSDVHDKLWRGLAYTI